MVRRILFAGLLLGPLVVVLHYVADLDETAEFVLAAVALIPLAWLIGEATEHAAEHTGPGIGGFLNATFGNAPELIIALLAVLALVRKFQPDIINVHGTFAAAVCRLVLAPTNFRRRIVYTVHCWPFVREQSAISTMVCTLARTRLSLL